jgi:hypothetical protein
LVIALPNIATPERKIFGKYWDGWNIPRHRYHFDPCQLRRMLIKGGFGNVKIFYETYSLLRRSFENVMRRRVPNRVPGFFPGLVLKGLGFFQGFWGFLLAVFKRSGAFQVICVKPNGTDAGDEDGETGNA